MRKKWATHKMIEVFFDMVENSLKHVHIELVHPDLKTDFIAHSKPEISSKCLILNFDGIPLITNKMLYNFLYCQSSKNLFYD